MMQNFHARAQPRIFVDFSYQILVGVICIARGNTQIRMVGVLRD
jgi:hypothetical protein